MSNYTLPITTSHSSLATFNTCPRKFFFKKVYPVVEFSGYQDSIDTVYGKAVGAGCATLLETGDLSKAYHILACEWGRTEIPMDSKKGGKSFGSALYALDLYLPEAEKLREYWTVKKSEQGFKVTCPQGVMAYVGFIDVLLEHKASGELKVVEFKTTACKYSPALFQNSYQGLGYFVAVKAHGDVNKCISYSILQTAVAGNTWHYDEYPVYPHDLQDFIYFLILKEEQMARMLDLECFPKSGGACIAWGRTCDGFGNCHFPPHTFTPVEKKDVDPHLQGVTWIETQLTYEGENNV